LTGENISVDKILGQMTVAGGPSVRAWFVESEAGTWEINWFVSASIHNPV